jgi:hypothetical protein
MTHHIEKLLKEPLFWACGVVLCIPMLGSKPLMHLRNALTIDRGVAEVVDLDRDLVAHPERVAKLVPDAGTNGLSLPGDASSDQVTASLPPLSPVKSKSASEQELESDSQSGLEDSLPVSLPSPSAPEFKAPAPEPPTRDPGSLFELTEPGEYDSTGEPAIPGGKDDPPESETSDGNQQDSDFDFLFGEDSQDVEPEPAPSGNSKPPGNADEYSSQDLDGVIPPPMDDANQFVPNDNDVDGPSTTPRSFEPPSSQPLDFAQPQSIDGAPFGEALPAQQYFVGAFQPGSVEMGTPAYNGQTVAPANVVVHPQTTWTAPVHVTPGYAIASGPIYQNITPIAHTEQSTARNLTVGLSGLFFQRDYEDNVRLAYNSAGENLYTNDADERTFDGYGITLASRDSSGGGVEASYWALNPGVASTSISGQVTPTITGLDQLIYTPSGDNLYDIYSYSVAQSITRDTDINNLELNLLRKGGTYCRWNRQGLRELFGGFRWFEFSESLQYATFTDTASYPSLPSEFYYNLQARNRLLGFQGGVRNELVFGPKLRFFNSVQGGIFNNNIRTAQNITDLYGGLVEVNAGPGTGRPFSYNDEKNDVAFLGELNFGLRCYLTCNARIHFGYRVLGVSGVALAANQLPFRYDNPDELLRAKSNGNLLLNGGFYGIEFCY